MFTTRKGKEMAFDILDLINEATKEADAFEDHPARELSLEERLLYLNGLALVMSADNDIDVEEKEYIRILIKSFEIDEIALDSFIEFAQAPDKDTIQAFFRTFRRRPIAQLFLFDALMMTRRDGKVEDKEIAVVNKIADQLEILKGTQQDIFDLFCHIKNRHWNESALYFSSHLLNPEHFKHLLDYHEVDFDELMKETDALRTDRLLNIIAQKNSNEENSKPIIDNEILMPALQAEVDRGNSSVVNNKITIVDNDYINEIDLSSLGLGWNKEYCALYLIESKITEDRDVIKYFLNLLEIKDINAYIKILYKSEFRIPVGTKNVDNMRELHLDKPLETAFQFLVFDNKYFKYTDAHYNALGQSVLYSDRSGFDSDNETQSLWFGLEDADSKGCITRVEASEIINFIVENGIPTT